MSRFSGFTKQELTVISGGLARMLDAYGEEYETDIEHRQIWDTALKLSAEVEDA